VHSPISHSDLLSDLAEPVCAFDLEDRLLYCNASAERLLGRSLDQLVGRHQDEVFSPELSSQLDQQRQYRRMGLSTVYEVTQRESLGRVRTFLIAGSPLHDGQRRLIGSCGVIRDISERKQRELLHEARTRLTLAISESLRSLVTIVDFSQCVGDVLARVGEVLGSPSAAFYQRDEAGAFAPAVSWAGEDLLLEGRAPLRTTLPESTHQGWVTQLAARKVLFIRSLEDLPPTAQAERTRMQEQRQSSLVILSIVYNNRQQGFLVFDNPGHLVEFSGETLSLLTILTDGIASVLNRRSSEQERGLLITAVEHSDDSVLISAADGTILYVNPAFERNTGYRRQEALGRNPRLLKSGRHDQDFYRQLWSTLKAGAVWRGELINRRKDGSLLYESCIISPILNAAGEAQRFVAVKRDLSRERQLESQLRQAQTLEAVGRLAAGVAHEINTPTQYIGDNITFFREAFDNLCPWVTAARALLGAASEAGGALGEQAAALLAQSEEIELDFLLADIPNALAQSQDGVERVAGIVRAMKEFSHPGHQGTSTNDLNHMLQSALAVSRSEWKHVATVRLELAEDLPPIVCHVAELNQALLNLLLNAAQAITETGAGRDGKPMGEIRVGSRLADEAFVVEIADTGGGIPPDVLPHIFAPFFTTKEVGKGTGQGLAVVHNVIVDMHGGQVGVSSEPGAGSTFRLTLPVKSPPVPAAKEDAA